MNSFLLEKPKSLNNSSIYKGFYKENIENNDYIDESFYKTVKYNENTRIRSCERSHLQRGELFKYRKVPYKGFEWSNFLKNTKNSEIMLNIDNFKYCCLNSKGVLFENEVYQIGLVYKEEIEGKNDCYKVFIGNKSLLPMNNCYLSLKQVLIKEIPIFKLF